MSRWRSSRDGIDAPIAPLQSLFGDAIRRSHSEYRNRDSALFVRPDGTILAYSDAILATLDQVGGVWKHIARALRRIPRRLRDRACTAFASNRNLPRSARSDGMSR